MRSRRRPDWWPAQLASIPIVGLSCASTTGPASRAVCPRVHGVTRRSVSRRLTLATWSQSDHRERQGQVEPQRVELAEQTNLQVLHQEVGVAAGYIAQAKIVTMDRGVAQQGKRRKSIPHEGKKLLSTNSIGASGQNYVSGAMAVTGGGGTFSRALPTLLGTSWGCSFGGTGFGAFSHSFGQRHRHAVSERPHLRR